MSLDWCITVSDFSRLGSSRGSAESTHPIAPPPEEFYQLLDMPLPGSQSDPHDERHHALRPRYFVSSSSDQLFPSLAKYDGYMLDDRRIISYQVRIAPRCIIPFAEYTTSGEKKIGN
jgi:hypothetical protein